MKPSSGPAFIHPRYDPAEELGRGAQGVVIRVIDRENPTEPLVAKVWQGVTARASTLEGEFALLSRMRIPGLVRAYDFSRCQKTNLPFLIESFVDGPDARTWLSEVPIAAKTGRIVHILASMASVLAQLHDAGFLHGDLKPEHVRIAQANHTPFPTLLDLGAAVANTQTMPGAFTPAFAAPEVRAGAAHSVASDLYGLGATILALIAKAAPDKRLRRSVFDEASWLPPSVAAVLEKMLAEHPRDRPSDARVVLQNLGVTGATWGRPPSPIGRDDELNKLRHAKPAGVHWIVGPAGAGKTHLVRELHTQWLLEGRDVRLLQFPLETGTLGRLIAFLRGNDNAAPFTFSASPKANPIVIVDDAHRAPEDFHAALDAYRCRTLPTKTSIEFVVTARSAPQGATVMPLEPLSDPAFQQLCATYAVHDRARIEALSKATQKNPGWLVAALGAMPLEQETAVERARMLSESAQDVLALLAVSGGEAPVEVCQRITRPQLVQPDVIAELSMAGLISRRLLAGRFYYSLFSPNLAQDLARALATVERMDRAADAWLEEIVIPATVLLALGKTAKTLSRQSQLLQRASEQARAEGLRSVEIDALLMLAEYPEERTVERLLRLERLLRDGNATASHPRVLEWLDAAAHNDARLRPLVLRRRAEKLIREGKTHEAIDVVNNAHSEAVAVNDEIAANLAKATRGVIALYQAQWEEADHWLQRAHDELKSLNDVDAEEMARINHNIGVVALYRGRHDDAIDAFRRALEVKRSLGDRAGVRSCLLNLGLALSKSQRYDDADESLREALELARSLGQMAGQGWCLVAFAEVSIRRRNVAKAREWLAEAIQLEGSLPPPIQADLCLLQAEVALLVGDGAVACAFLDKLDSNLRATDALVDARAYVLESRSCLARMPVDKRRAARLAICAIRRSRSAKLREMEVEAVTALRLARPNHRPEHRSMLTPPTQETALWSWLADVSTGLSFDDATNTLARLILQASGAERVFFARVDAAGTILDAIGLDFDNLPIALPTRRIATELIEEVLRTPNPILLRNPGASARPSCRLAISEPNQRRDGSRTILLLEHRFSSTAFDHLSETALRQWAILAGLSWICHSNHHAPTHAMDSTPGPQTHTTSIPADTGGQTTFFPVTERRRTIPTIAGHSASLERALVRLDAAIDTDLPTLIFGETGTGKELFARALHDYGRRSKEPFVAVNCGAIPDTLFEAELFGHVRGSFTGAERQRPGLLARADKGTLFLDEIGELPLLRQATLLRTLQDKTYRPVGSDEEIAFDARIVAATNRNLEEAVEEGTFRRDLLYRLNTLEIHVPPLRERRSDIAALAQLFLTQAKSTASLSHETIVALENYDWPGNVRQLEHVIQRLALHDSSVIDPSFLPREIRTAVPSNTKQIRAHHSNTTGGDDVARREVQEALARHHGNISRAAISLGLTRHGLKKRMVRLGLRPPNGGTKREA